MRFCEVKSDLMHTHTHTFAGFIIRKLSDLCHIYRQPPHFADYFYISVCAALSHTQTKTGPQRGQSMIFKESFSLPCSQTSLCSSKNKIPPVKLGAPRFWAFNTEANQTLREERERRWLNLSRPLLKCSKFTHTKFNWKC